MAVQTSLLQPKVSIEIGQEEPSFYITGGDRGALSAGSIGNDLSVQSGANPKTVGIELEVESLTTVAQPDSLISAARALQLGLLTHPAELGSLLTQAVAATQQRRHENVESWAERVAEDAARLDA